MILSFFDLLKQEGFHYKALSRSAESILSPPEADSSFHGKEPGGLGENKLSVTQPCFCISRSRFKPQGSFQWKELSASGGLRMASRSDKK